MSLTKVNKKLRLSKIDGFSTCIKCVSSFVRWHWLTNTLIAILQIGVSMVITRVDILEETNFEMKLYIFVGPHDCLYQTRLSLALMRLRLRLLVLYVLILVAWLREIRMMVGEWFQ